MVDFAVRSQQSELMDDPSVEAGEMRSTLDELATINRAFNAYWPSIEGVAGLVPAHATELTLLDVGCGGGDFARRLAEWAAGRGLRLRLLGIDLLTAAVDYASASSKDYDGVDFRVADLFALEGETFDVVHASQVLHHFETAEASRALAKMFALARWGVVIHDLHRHPLAYYSIKLVTRCFSRNRLIRNDGPVSVLRGFRRRSLGRLAREADLPEPEIRWRWAFRWQMVIRKAPAAGRRP